MRGTGALARASMADLKPDRFRGGASGSVLTLGLKGPQDRFVDHIRHRRDGDRQVFPRSLASVQQNIAGVGDLVPL